MINNKDIDDKKIKNLIHSIGLKYNLQDDIINKVINSQYKFTREIISKLNLDEVNSKEDLALIKTNFIYPYIGKLYIKYDFMERLERLKNYKQNINGNKEFNEGGS